MTRLYIELIATATLLVAFWAFIHHERQVGVQQCQVNVDKAIAAQSSSQASVHLDQSITVTHIEDTFHDTTTYPVTDAPVVRVCNNQVRTVYVPQASSATSGDHASASSRAEVTQGVDIGKPIVTIGKDADAQVKALQDYITGVCLK